MWPVRMLSFLMLIFSLYDAGSTCATEFNPLILDPRVIIAEYGGNPVTVNCTSVEHEGMYWTVGNESSPIEEEDFFISQSVPLSDWDVKAECKIKLNESYECSKELEVILFKNPDVVCSVQHENVMGEETQYRLQCDIINVAPVQYLTVSWYKNNESIRTQSFNATTKTPVNESSVLRVTISREENVVEFRCEAQLDFGPHGPQLPVISQTHNVAAHYAPELKTKNSPHDISPLEGTNITLSCEAEGNPPPFYQWTCDGVNLSENTNSLSITRVKHNVTCTCTAANYVGNVTKTFHVHVKERGCPLTLRPSEIVVRFGDPVSINCSTSATYVVGMGWEAPFGGTGFELPPAVTWSVEQMEEWTPSPSCYATLDDGSQCLVSPVITVYKPPDSVSVSAVDHSSIVEGTEYDLKCYINNVAVQNLSVTWHRGNETVLTQTFHESNVTLVNRSSTLRVTAHRDHNGLTFRCEAGLHPGPKEPEFPPSVISAPYTAVVLYAPDFKEGNDSKEVLQGESVTLSCSADSNPPSNIGWIYTTAVNSKETTEGRQRTVTITRATFTNAGVYLCVAENKVGRKARSVTLVVKDKTSNILFPAIWASLAVLAFILILLVLICYKRRNARGRYSFAPVKASDIPLTTTQANGRA